MIFTCMGNFKYKFEVDYVSAISCAHRVRQIFVLGSRFDNLLCFSEEQGKLIFSKNFYIMSIADVSILLYKII